MLTVFNVSMMGPFPDKGPGKSIFHDKGALKVQTILLRAGQKIPPCAMEHDVLFYVVKGSATLIVDGEAAQLREGAGVVVPKEAKSREMRALDDLTVLAVQGRSERV